MRYIVQTLTKAGVDQVSDIAQAEHSRFRYSDGDWAVDVTVSESQLQQIIDLSTTKQIMRAKDVLLGDGVSDPGEWNEDGQGNEPVGSGGGGRLVLLAVIAYLLWRSQ